MKRLSCVVMLAAVSACKGGGSSGAAKIPDGEYNLGAYSCETGVLTDAGEVINDSISSGVTGQIAAVSGTSVTIVSDIGPSANDYCMATVTGTLSYDGSGEMTTDLGGSTWTKHGMGLGDDTCPSAVSASAHDYSIVVGEDKNVVVTALDAADASFSPTFCSTGLVRRTYVWREE